MQQPAKSGVALKDLILTLINVLKILFWVKQTIVRDKKEQGKIDITLLI